MLWEYCFFHLTGSFGQENPRCHFPGLLSRNLFQQILRYLHMIDNSKTIQSSFPAYDKLWKIRPLIELTNDVSQI